MRLAGLAVALAGAAALWLAMLLLGGGAVDAALLAALRAGPGSTAAVAAGVVTGLGGAAVLLPVTLAVCLALLLRGDRRAAAWFAAMTLAGRLLVELQKGWTMRLRPDPLGEVAPIASYAFPSGHSANATMVWLGAALLLAGGRARRRAIAGAALAAFLVGLSRPMLGVHWPSDVVGGWAFGLVWTLLLVRLCETPPTDCSPASA